MRYLILSLVAALITSQAHAIIWGGNEVDDPFSDATCLVSSLASYGSYIYNFPSKYDAVFFPHTDSQSIWYCGESGYASFMGDFEELTAEERVDVAQLLAGADTLGENPTVFERLERLEDVYSVRTMEDTFWPWFYRVLAHYYQSESPERALEYRSLALPLVEQQIENGEPDGFMIQNLYVAGDYHRQLGNTDRAMEYFAQARTLEWVDESGTQRVGIDYWTEIINEREALIP